MNLYELKVEVDSTYEEVEEWEIDPKDVKICLHIADCTSVGGYRGAKDITLDRTGLQCFLRARKDFNEKH